MYQGIGEGLDAFFKMCLWLLAVFVPLGLWKLIDILIYLANHLTISWGA